MSFNNNSPQKSLSNEIKSMLVVSRRYSLFSREIEGMALDNLGDEGITGTSINTLGRPNRRRCSLFFKEQEFSNIDDRVEICNDDFDMIKDASSIDENLDGSGGTTRTGMNTPGLPNRRRFSLFFKEQGLSNTSDRVELCNDDIDRIKGASIDEIRDESISKNVDRFDDNLSPIKDHLRFSAKKERNLSLTMNFDIKSLFSSDEESRRASIAFAKFVIDELDTTNVAHSTKKERTLSLAMGFDMKSLFSSDEESRRASMTFAKLISEELDTTNIAQTKQHDIDSQRVEQLSQVTPTADSPPSFPSNLANYYLMIQDNLCKAMRKSEKTRAVIEKMKANALTQVPQVTESLKRKAIKKSQLSKHILGRKNR